MSLQSSDPFTFQQLVVEDGISISSKYKVVALSVRPRMPVYTSRRICELVQEGEDQKKHIPIKSKYGGTVKRIMVKVGDIITSGDNIIEVAICQHPTVLGSICCDCGMLLEEKSTISCNDKMEKTHSLVSMLHTMPNLKVSEKEAKRLGSQDQEFLLNKRKLVLLVDLDQTLVHTTNDNIPPNLKDVYHFQLSKRGQWYHTRLRPYTRKFLDSISSLYELHICTFGIREYAHFIAHFLDKDQKLFSNRILSRNECLDPMSKKANLSSLFPCGDDMVCIIDDRSDVWHFASNVVQVMPYHFFKHTGDINAPPGLQKKENDTKRGFDFTKSLGKKKKLRESDDDMSTASESTPDDSSRDSNKPCGSSKTESKFNASDNSNGKGQEVKDAKEEGELETSDDEGDKTLCAETEVSDVNDEKNPTNEDESKSSIEVKEKDKDSDIEEDRIETSTSNDVKENEATVKDGEDTPNLGKNNSKGDEDTPDLGKSNLKGHESEESTESTDVKISDNDTLETYKPPETISTSSVLDESKMNITTIDTTIDTTLETTVAEDDDDDDEIDVPDSDDYLLYLEDILRKLHKTFYDIHDKEKKLPDLKEIVPDIRGNVLKGVNLVFSGVYPHAMDLKSSKAYHIARSLGAIVTERIIVKPKRKSVQNSDDGMEKEELYTTHVVAANLHTEKCHKAKRINGLHIVTPNWLWSCAERWERADERIFILNSESEKSVCRNPPMHCFINKRQPPKELEPLIVKEDLRRSSQSSDTSSSTPRMDDINPFAFFSNDETKSMEQEVNQLLSDKDDDDDDKESVDSESTSSNSQGPSSSEEDSNRKCKKRKTFEKNDTNNEESDNDTATEENEDDELPSIRFRQGGALPSDDSSNNSDEDLNAFGDILERQLMD